MADDKQTEQKPRRVGDGTPGPGRPKGVPNKASATMKAAIQSVYDQLQETAGGDHAHFKQWAFEEPTEFYKLASKLLPIQAEHSGAVSFTVHTGVPRTDADE